MSFYWFLDIEEYDPSPTPGYAPGSEVVTGGPPVGDDETGALYAVGAAEAFSVGPIAMEHNSQMSVLTLVNKIQSAFDEAFGGGICSTQYYIQARVRPIVADTITMPDQSIMDGPTMGGNAVTGLSQDLAGDQVRNKIGTATADRELVIEYRIYNEESKPFNILFRSGPHGFAGGIGGAQSELDGPPIGEVTIVNKPDIKGLAALYAELDATITDKPPMPPDIEFVPFVGVNNKVMVWFNSNAGEGLQKPIMLRDSDATFIADEYFSQYGITITAAELLADTTPQKLLYRNDDPVRRYELFRIEEKPTSYDDFRNFNVTPSPLQAKLASDKYSTGVAYVDTLVPNKKYYYCARSIDIHNNISNPTAIFEIEIVDNRGQLFMKNKVFMFDPIKMNYTKAGRRFVAIRPRATQTYYSPDLPGSMPSNIGVGIAPSDNLLGTAETRQGHGSIWGKKFKVRLRSTKTARQIDLNVTFKNEGVENP